MFYYKLRLNHGKTHYGHDWHDFIHFRWPMELSLERVVQTAVQDGMLLDVFAPLVDKVEIITREEYCEHCWEDV